MKGVVEIWQEEYNGGRRKEKKKTQQKLHNPLKGLVITIIFLLDLETSDNIGFSCVCVIFGKLILKSHQLVHLCMVYTLSDLNVYVKYTTRKSWVNPLRL